MTETFNAAIKHEGKHYSAKFEFGQYGPYVSILYGPFDEKIDNVRYINNDNARAEQIIDAIKINEK